jgi:uncharacterized protein (TIGR02757 family)
MNSKELKIFLDRKVDQYNQPSFIKDDPISIPHLFTKKQDIEIAGLFAAVFAWGNRTTIIKKSKELMGLMDMQPHTFCLNPGNVGLKKMKNFKHRTFTADDLYYFLHFLHQHYKLHNSLESAFFPRKNMSTEEGLIHFKKYFFSFEHLKRTEKHISSPLQKSTCKRLNMFLRWMVRDDKKGVDFGIWKAISSADLICPVDVHVTRVAKKLGLLKNKNADWKAAVELTEALRKLDKRDPVKYDFALFSLGVIEKF